MALPVDDRYAWWRALHGSDLSPTARHVALSLSTYMNKSGEGAWPSMATLAEATGRSVPTVKRAIRELRDADYLAVASGGGRRGDGGYVSNRYRATVPNGVTHDPAPWDEPDDLTGSSQQGTGSSQQGTGSPMTVNGVTHDPQTAHELPIQQPKHHSASTKRAADAADKVSSLLKRPEPTPEQLGDEARKFGQTLGQEIAKGAMTETQAVDMFQKSERIRDYGQAFRDGVTEGIEQQQVGAA